MKDVLDLRNDLVFKYFFGHEKNKDILIAFLTAVIKPKEKISYVKILDPLLLSKDVNKKASALDLLVELENGTQVNVEIQMLGNKYFKKRILYYWAKIHNRQLERGDDYKKLMPSILVAILNYNEFEHSSPGTHSIFKIQEINRGELYSDDLELHFLELRKKDDKIKSELDIWIDLFLLKEKSEQEREKLKENNLMSKAIITLEELAEIRRNNLKDFFREREEWLDQFLIEYEAREEGLKEGKREGKREGMKEGASEAIKKIVFRMKDNNVNEQDILNHLGITIDEYHKIIGK